MVFGQEVHEGMEIVKLANGDPVSCKHRLDALLDCLLRVKADNRIVDLGIGDQFPKSVYIVIRQF